MVQIEAGNVEKTKQKQLCLAVLNWAKTVHIYLCKTENCSVSQERQIRQSRATIHFHGKVLSYNPAKGRPFRYCPRFRRTVAVEPIFTIQTEKFIVRSLKPGPSGKKIERSCS